MRSSADSHKNTNQLVHFVRAGFHFVVHHNFLPLCDLVQSTTAGSSVSELATSLEQLCKQRETREKCEGEKKHERRLMDARAVVFPDTCSSQLV